MKNIIKMELKKAFFSKWFVLGLVLLGLFSVLSGFYMIGSRQDYNPDLINIYAIVDGEFTTNPDLPLYGFYNSWVGGEELSLASTLFYTLLPICAAIPYATSYYSERKTGYLKNIITRVEKKKYLLIKMITVFTTGVIVTLIPLVINLFMVSAFVPVCDLFVGYTFYNHILFGSMWIDILYTNPLLFTILFVLLTAFYGGIYAILSYSISFYINKFVAIIFVPFLLMMLGTYLQNIIYEFLDAMVRTEFIPINFLHSRSNTFAFSVIIVTLIIIGLSVISTLLKLKKEVF